MKQDNGVIAGRKVPNLFIQLPSLSAVTKELKVSLNVRPNITFARIWNLIKRACDYEYESIYHFPGSYVGRNMNDIKCMRCGKTATSLIYYNGLSIDVCGGCLFYYDSDASFAYPRDNT